MQTIVSVLLLLIAPSTFSYPVFGTKRYQRASYPSPQQAAYAAYPQYVDEPMQQQYNGLPDDVASYYYQQQQQQQQQQRQHYDRYPVYYGMPSYIDPYQQPAGAPYYGNNAGPIYGYQQDESPMDDLHDEIRQEDEYERNHFPTGEEIWYEPPGRNTESLARTNAAFLNNLIKLNSKFGRPNIQIPQEYENQNPYNEVFDYDDNSQAQWWESNGKSAGKNQKHVKQESEEVDEEDKDVQELKALVNQHRKEYDSLYSQQDLRHDMPTYNQDYDHDYDEAWINWDSKRSAPKKVQPEMVDAKKPAKIKSSKSASTIVASKTATSSVTPTEIPTTTTSTVKPQKFVVKAKGSSGQKEIVLPRPATPVRHPFRSSVMLDTSNSVEQSKKDTQSIPSGAIYDTIKQMFTMEQKLDEETHPQQKRYVSSEESLVQQLNGLKRHYSA